MSRRTYTTATRSRSASRAAFEDPDAPANERVGLLFAQLAAREPEPSVRQVRGVLEFDVDGAGRWYATLADGRLSLEPSALRADCVIGCGAQDLVEVATGRRNLLTTFLQGRATCAGDVALALAFQRLLPLVP